MSMALSPMGLLLLLCAPLLGYYAYRRYREYRRNTENHLDHYYFLAATAVSAAFLFYGLPGVLAPGQSDLVVVGAVAATGLNAFGFSHFFMAALYGYLPRAGFVVGKHLLYLTVIGIVAALLITPPQSFVDARGVIHWRFTTLTSFAMFSLIGAAFLLNITLILKNMARLRKFSFRNAAALVATFLATGIGGGYLYLGDDADLLLGASALLALGVAVIFIASVIGALRPPSAAGPGDAREIIS